LILVSHDRWFVTQLATRVVEISERGIRDYHGSYEEYVHALGDDHLDADAVLQRARRDGRDNRERAGTGNGRKESAQQIRGRSAPSGGNVMRLERQRDEVTSRIEQAEQQVAEIDATFAAAGYFERTSPEEVQQLQEQRDALQAEVEQLMEEWEQIEERIEGARAG